MWSTIFGVATATAKSNEYRPPGTKQTLWNQDGRFPSTEADSKIRSLWCP